MVNVRSVQFNPFLLRLTVKKLSINDAGQQIMVGFDRFFVDVSFKSLLKKIYRIESLELEGLNVNAVLLKDGSINLLSLVAKNALNPPEANKASEQPQPQKETVTQKAVTSGAQAAETNPLPPLEVDLISIHNGAISFTDQSVNPYFVTSLRAITVRVTGVSTRPDAEARISFNAQLDDKGAISTETLVKPFAAPLSLETVFKLNDYALQVLTPYVGKYTGRTVGNGKLNLSMNYRISENKLSASHKVLVQSFDFGDKVESKDALSLPFGLALALLEDGQGRINISLPVTGDMSQPDFHYFQVLGQVLKKFVLKLVTKPFSFLGSMIGMESGSEEWGYVRFLPGKTDLSDAEKEKLDMIVKALSERPKLRLELRGSYDPVLDWKAIKEDIFNKDFLALKEASKRQDNLEMWAYQQLYQRRFGKLALWSLTKSFWTKEGFYDEVKLREAIKRQLIEDESADKVALAALGEARAKAAYDFIVAAGFDSKRMSIKEPQETQGSAGSVPLELALTIFESARAASIDPFFAPELKK